MKNIIILSGGLDSTTLLHHLHSQEIGLKAVTFDYGSKHNKQEQICAKYHCEQLGIEHIVIEMDFIKKHFKSNLLQGGDAIPEGHYADSNMKKTVVPFRNGIMLSIAAGLAESEGSEFIYVGSHFGDHAVYPDCREDFIIEMRDAISKGTYNSPIIVAPYTTFSKSDIAGIASKLQYDFYNTYSCYNGDEVQCGRCSTCFERREAFHLAGVQDMTFYKDKTPIEELIKEYEDGKV